MWGNSRSKSAGDMGTPPQPGTPEIKICLLPVLLEVGWPAIYESALAATGVKKISYLY